MFKAFEWPAQKAAAKKIETEEVAEAAPEATPDRLINYGKLILKAFCRNFSVEGEDQIKQFKKEHADDKFIITGSHTNNLDVPAALKTLGPEFNMQVTGNELFFTESKYLAQKIGVKTLFRDRFTGIGQKSEDGKESGVFNPDDFRSIDKEMDNGRTPWMAAHSFSMDGQMRQVDNGAVLEAYRQNAWIVPTALELISGSKNMQGVGEIAKNLKDSGAKYHIGQPYKPEPLPQGMDINIITDVIDKRKRGELVSDEEFSAFKEAKNFLSVQTEKLGQAISGLLPEEQRGYYKQS
jgi:hypothetical protein